MCWMGLCVAFGLKFGLCVIAGFRKLRGYNDNGWFCGRAGICGAVGVVSTLLCSSLYVFGLVDIFVLYSFICASKNILFIDDKKFQKILQIVYVLHVLVCLLVCV